MTAAAKALPAVLDHIDADLDNSLERLFEFLRIPSISTDPAYKDTAAPRPSIVAKDLDSLGFETAVRPTAGHPVVVGKATARQRQRRSARAVLRPLRRAAGRSARLWETPPFEPRIDDAADGRKVIVGARRLRRQGPGHDLRRGLPRLQGGDRRAAARITMMIEGEEECGSKNLFAFVREQCRRVQARPRAGLRHRHVGRRRRRRSPPRCAAWSTRR